MGKKNFTIPNNFGALPEEDSGYDNSKVLILPVPLEQTVTYRRGTKDGPRAIIEASKNLELYDEELNQDIYKVGIHTLDEIEPLLSDPGEMIDELRKIIASELRGGRFVIPLGGEHSITVASVRAYKEQYENLSVLQLDAHADLRDSYSGTKYSHACVVRRILDDVPVVQAGIRSLSREEADFVAKEKRELFFARDLVEHKVSVDEIVSKLTDEVYVTFDLDVLDPSIMPSVGTPEPGGLNWYDTLTLLRGLAERKRIVGFDVVELSPIPGNVSPDFLTAKLIYKLIGYIFKENYHN